MRILDALSAMRLGKKEPVFHRDLSTVWSENLIKEMHKEARPTDRSAYVPADTPAESDFSPNIQMSDPAIPDTVPDITISDPSATNLGPDIDISDLSVPDSVSDSSIHDASATDSVSDINIHGPSAPDPVPDIDISDSSAPDYDPDMKIADKSAKAYRSESVLPEYPRPQFRRDNWICLNGLWEYSFTSAKDRPGSIDGQILVPFSPETTRSGVNRQLKPGEYLWYARSISIDEISEGQHLILHFGAVDQRCSVWWNGHLMGTHQNGYLSFSFDVTEYLREGTNTLWVRVQDDSDQGLQCRGKQTLQPGGMFYTAQSGIWQTVWMEWVPEKKIESLKITPLFDENKVRLEISLTERQNLSIQIDGNGDSYYYYVKKRDFQHEFAAVKPKSNLFIPNPENRNVAKKRQYIFSEQADQTGSSMDSARETAQSSSVSPSQRAQDALSDSDASKDHPFIMGQSGYASIICEIPILNMRSWSPEEPFLYRIYLTSGQDRVESYFAMRKFSVGKDDKGYPRLMLNNKPYFMNGVLDQGYWPESLYTAPSDEAMIHDIRTMKQLGFNMIRKHLKIEPMRWYYHCDRLGMIVWQDMVNGGGKIFLPFLCYLPTALPMLINKVPDTLYPFFARANRKARHLWEESLTGMIDQLYNCPSIALWCPFNEGWGQFDSLRIAEKIRRQDPTRLIDHASGWFDQGGGDIKSVHNYFRKLTVTSDRRPFVLSEYGGITCRVNGHIYCDRAYGYRTCRTSKAFSKAFRKLQNEIQELEKQGLAAAIYTQVSDIEEEINGLMTYDRKVLKYNQSLSE